MLRRHVQIIPLVALTVFGIGCSGAASDPSTDEGVPSGRGTPLTGVHNFVAAAIDWKPCPGAEGAECATLKVPLDWAKPDGETTHIGLARRRAKDQANRIGSILMDPGGPGESGVSEVMSGDVLTEKVSARFDVVGFDPRGINTSQQILCDQTLSEQAAQARHPTSQKEFDKLVSLNKQLIASCRQNSGALVDHVDNIHTAHDMDAIRAALGEEKLNYVGYSYGTLMGQQYAELFPERIRAMVNDGNMDHSLSTAWDFMRTVTEPVEKNFVEFAEWCDATATCALHGLDTKRVYGELREKAKAGTLTDPATGERVDFYKLSEMAFSVNSPPDWGALAKSLKAFKDRQGAAVSSLMRTAAAANIPHAAIWCSDWRYPIANFAEYDELRTKLAKEIPNLQWTTYVDHALRCAGDPLKTTNLQRPLSIEGAPPLVMIGNIHDYATVYAWNKAAAEQSGSHLITYEGWGHTIYRRTERSPCVNDAVDAYLIDLTVPKKGLSCPATENPALTHDLVDLNPHSSGPYTWTR